MGEPVTGNSVTTFNEFIVKRSATLGTETS